MCVYWQFVILRGLSDSSVEICGTGAAMLTFTFAAFWGMPLVMLLYDAVQSYRGKLPRPIKWLRTLPAATAVLLTPMLLFFG